MHARALDVRNKCLNPDGVKIFGHGLYCMGQLCGLAITRDAKGEALPLRASYDLDEYIVYSQHTSREHLALCHFVLSPIFQRHAKRLLGEVMRDLRRSCVYHRVYPSSTNFEASNLKAYSVSSIVPDLIPVKPRPQIQYPLDVLHSNAPSPRIRDLGPPFSLLFMTRKMLAEPKVAINARIVVLGNSDAALACLQELVYQ